jgi:hypothetical protein
MAGPNLTDDELREAAAEAGISPEELRIALAERHGNLPATRPRLSSLVGPPTRGASATSVEGRLELPPPQALSTVRASIERQIGKQGHKQGDSEVDIVDDDAGLTYRLRAVDDDAGGALVRIDVDPGPARGTAALASTGILGVTTTLVALGWLFGATTLWLGGLGLGVVGGLWIARRLARSRGAVASAHAVSAQALLEAEDRVAAALPPAR